MAAVLHFSSASLEKKAVSSYVHAQSGSYHKVKCHMVILPHYANKAHQFNAKKKFWMECLLNAKVRGPSC